MIRDFLWSDVPDFLAIHEANKLPEQCLVPFGNPLFVIDRVLIPDGFHKPAMGIFVKVTSEVYLMLDHAIGTPEERWNWLVQITADMRLQAYRKGFEEITCWLPVEVEKSFGDRILTLGFHRSKWQSYTLLVW